MVLSQSPPIELTESQRAVLQKYFINGESTWEAVATRVAYYVASAEETPELQREWQEKFLSILLPMKLVPGGSILANSDHGTRGLLNCFVLSAEDNIHDITKLVSDAVLTTKFRGGVGINIGAEGQKGYIRPKGSPFQDGKALGPCSVLDMVSENSKKITTGNKARRGAFLFSMDWKHPDILEFIQAKTQSTIDAAFTKTILEQMAQLVQHSDLTPEEKQQRLQSLNQQLATAWVETHLSPEGKRDRRWHNANISVQLIRLPMSCGIRSPAMPTRLLTPVCC
jgi:ribonucleoside-diphosphate reductase alpha chain